jgi:hypothetical protein
MGEKKGKMTAKIEDAKNLLREKIPPEIIAKCIGIDLEEVQKLADE